MAANRHLNILLCLLLALAALLLLLLGIASAAGLTAPEPLLNPNGSAYELNPDSEGTLWISDYGIGEISSFEPTGGVTTTYQVGGSPSDAHSDGMGSVWWADFASNKLGRLSTATHQATVWEIPGSISLYSTAIDSSTGDVWVSESSDPFIYKLDPDTNQLCTYKVPNAGVTEYLYLNGGQLWFGDTFTVDDTLKAQIVRLQDGTFDWWELPEGNYPQDLELDRNGQLWWTDRDNRYLGRLDTGAAAITTFTPPVSPVGTPKMLALSGGKVWYSQQFPSQVVVLDPAVAIPDAPPVEVATGTQPAALTCDELLPLDPTPVTVLNGQAEWTGQTYAMTLNTAGWGMYDMPEGSLPSGIAAAGKIWLVDQGRQVLARLSTGSYAYLPLVQKP
jgi:streptogramin lyase